MPLSKEARLHLIHALAHQGHADDVADIIDKLENDVEALSGSGIEYSTLEVDTGNKWVDGKAIFRRAFTLPAQGNSDPDDFALGITADALISVSGYVNDGVLKKPLPYVPLSTEANESIRVILNSSGTNLQIRTGSSGAHDGGVVVIEYTKV